MQLQLKGTSLTLNDLKKYYTSLSPQFRQSQLNTISFDLTVTRVAKEWVCFACDSRIACISINGKYIRRLIYTQDNQIMGLILARLANVGLHSNRRCQPPRVYITTWSLGKRRSWKKKHVLTILHGLLPSMLKRLSFRFLFLTTTATHRLHINRFVSQLSVIPTDALLLLPVCVAPASVSSKVCLYLFENVFLSF